MWCQHCQQDAPAIAIGNAESACARCGKSFETGENAQAVERTAAYGIDLTSSSSANSAAETFALESDWLLHQDLRRLQRRLGTSPDLKLVHAAEDDTDPSPASIKKSRHYAKPLQRQAIGGTRPMFLSIIAWTLISLGLMALVCGGVLVAWSFFGARNDLWSRGMPIAFCGQFCLLLGLVLQLDFLGRLNRRTTEALEEVDLRLRAIDDEADTESISFDASRKAHRPRHRDATARV